ncbi:hypothetical protein KM043_015442 [Ampulex compressa]|nr:hypothetical protein KM043_015442 [Ampulex compressa]
MKKRLKARIGAEGGEIYTVRGFVIAGICPGLVFVAGQRFTGSAEGPGRVAKEGRPRRREYIEFPKSASGFRRMIRGLLMPRELTALEEDRIGPGAIFCLMETPYGNFLGALPTEHLTLADLNQSRPRPSGSSLSMLRDGRRKRLAESSLVL